MSVDLDDLVDRLQAVGGVVAVMLGGSRSTGEHTPDSDWDIGVYYERRLDTDAIRAWGWPGQVFEPGDWAGYMDGGAWLHNGDGVGAAKVDLIYRNIVTVDKWLDEAAEGRWEIERVPAYLAGMPSYALAAELALGRKLSGTVPSPEFGDALAESADRRWRWEADFALEQARQHLARGDQAMVRGQVVYALLALGHARLAGRKTWIRNEKGLLDKAELTPAARRFDLIADQHGVGSAFAWLTESLEIT